MSILRTVGPVNGAIPILPKGEVPIRSGGHPVRNLTRGPDPGANHGPNPKSQCKTKERTVKDREPKGNSNSGANEATDPQWLVHPASNSRYFGNTGPPETAAGFPAGSAVIRFLQFGDVQLAHPQHGLHGTLRSVGVGACDQGRED